MKYQLSILGIVAIVMIAASAGALLANSVSRASGEPDWFDIEVDSANGTNEYTMIEVDEGDNNEERVVTQILHVFEFSAVNPAGVITWDFGDGTSAMGAEVNHSYQEPGTYMVMASSIDEAEVQTSALWVVVDLIGFVESDNMECECAPTAKDTVVDITPLANGDEITGFVRVEHDGSSESCSLRNPLQECHLRVIIQKTDSGEVISNDVIYDSTFRSNELVVDFELIELDLEEGQGVQIRLETDQLRDWHKPYTEWSMTGPF